MRFKLARLDARATVPVVKLRPKGPEHVAEDFDFREVIATAIARVSAETDWTCRVLAAGLKPRRVYWYRFTDKTLNEKTLSRC